MHIGGHGNAHPQGIVLELLRINGNAYRQSLHHLDPVPGGILGWDHRECRAGAAADAFDPAMEYPARAVNIRLQRDRLARPDMLDLAFLEIGVDKQLLYRHHGHQFSPCGDLLANLDPRLGDNAVHRRAD